MGDLNSIALRAGKRQKAKGEALPQLFAFTNVLTFLSTAIKTSFLLYTKKVK
jgi:hypothetical protein